ncbi:MAG: cell division protein ZapD [Thiogranum sp.]
MYEQPLNERIRTFLRLEFLFSQASQHMYDESQWGSRSTLSSLLDILSIFGRTDLKTEVLKELERHSTTLSRLESNPGVDRALLKSAISELELLGKKLHQSSGPIAADLKSNEFLTSIQQRLAIPGGTCDFDLPAFHFWLQQPAQQRTRDLASWLNRFDAVGRAIQAILRLVRESAAMKPVTAEGGFFQKTLDSTHPCQLVRVALDPNIPCYAEISGGRHRFTVRFMETLREGHVRQTTNRVPFELGCCVI